jgi:hypothetical protein
MKKDAVKVSGLLTSILSFLVFLSMLIIIFVVFGVNSAINFLPENLISVIYIISIYPLATLFSQGGLVSQMIVTQVAPIVFALVSLGLFIWGIKEMTLSKKSDENFARCQKTCGFMMAVKFLFFLYNLFLIIYSFANADISAMFNIVSALIGFSYSSQFILIIVALSALANFIVPVVSFSNAVNYLKKSNTQPEQQYVQQQPVNSQTADGTVYQAPYYNVQKPQPLKARTIAKPDTQTEDDPNVINIIPGQNGVPLNITQKGVDDLIRLERLRASGTIDEDNYAVMKEKICTTNIS